MSDMEFKIGADTSAVEKGVNDALKAINRFANEATKASSKLNALGTAGERSAKGMKELKTYSGGALANLRDLSIVMTTATYALNGIRGATENWVTKIVETNAEIEKLTFLLANMSKSAKPFEEAGNQIKYLRDMSKSVPFSISQLSDSFVKFKAAGLDPMDGSFKSVIDAISAFGGSDEQLQRITLGISQMSGKSVLSMEEMRQQLGEAMPRAMELMARALNTSIGELSAKIATGTVESKSALKAFFYELEMTYGGTAQRMMQTFNGQVSQLRTNFQLLATQGSNKRFFEELKGTMQEFNDFLNSSDATRIADKIGEGLSKSLSIASSAVKLMYEYSDVLMRLGAALGIAFAGKIVGGAFQTLATNIANIRIATQNLKFGFGELGAAAQLMGSDLGKSQNKFRDFFQLISSGGLPALKGFSGLLMAIGPAAVVAGTGIMVAIDYFDLFGERQRKAFEDAVEYGAKTREEWDKIEADANERIAKLEKTENRLKAILDNPENRSPGVIAKARARYEDVKAQRETESEGVVKGAQNTQANIASAAARDAKRQAEAITQELQKEYTKQMDINAARYNAEQKNAAENGKSLQDIDRRYREENLKARLTFNEKQIELIEKLRSDTEKAAKGTTGKVAEELNLQVEEHTKNLTSLRQQSTDLRSGIGQMQFLNSDDSGKNLSKAKTHVDNLKQKFAELRGTVNDTNGELGELFQKISQGDYGNLATASDDLKEQLSTMIEMTAQVDLLSGAMRGYKSVTGNIARAHSDLAKRSAIAKRILSGQSKELQKHEEIQMDIDAGVYEGIGPNADAAIVRLRQTFEKLKSNAEMADLVGKVLQHNTFGQMTDSLIVSTGKTLDEFNKKLRETAGIANSISFANMSMPADGMLGNAHPYQSLKKKSGNPFLDFIAGPESGGDYNRSLDSGKWIGGEKNLVSMTLNEILQLQRMMLSNPMNRATYKDKDGNAVGSSAIGRYQIVSKTLRNLMMQHGLTGNELYNEEMQDFLAMSLARGRGRDAAGLRNEWEGLRDLSDAQILAAYDQGNVMGPTKWAAKNFTAAAVPQPTLQNNGSFDLNSAMAPIIQSAEAMQQQLETAIKVQIDKLKKDESKVLSEEAKAAYVTALKEFEQTASKAKLQGDDMGSLEADIRTKIGDKAHSLSGLSVKEQEEIIAKARETDVELKKLADTRKTERDITREIKETEKERAKLAKELEAAQAKLKDPNAVVDSSDVQRIKASYDELLAKIEQVHGKDAEIYKKTLGERDSLLKSQLQKEVLEYNIAENEKKRAYDRSMMNETQRREYDMSEQIKATEARKALYLSAGYSEIEATRMVEEQKARIRQQYAAQDDKVSQTFEKWADLQGSVQGKIEGWMNSFADGLTGLITGTGDLKSAIDGMIKDVVNMSLKWAMSQMWNKGSGVAAGGGGGKAAKGGNLKSLFMKGMPTRHLGGSISNNAGMRKNISGFAFAGAKYFHGGGVIGREGLLPNEVPLIGKKGEVVFTPGQVEALGKGITSSATNVISPRITVNASGGTPDQNSDLAKQISKEVEKSMSGMVAKELSRQQRPGNMIGRRR